MEPKALWIDDKLEQGGLFRLCMIETGFVLDVASSYFEASHRIETVSYDLVLMRPELALEPQCYFSGEERDTLVPFYTKIESALRNGDVNSDTPLHLFVYSEEYCDESKKIRDALRSKGWENKDTLTQLMYLGETRPATFGYDMYEFVLRSELEKFTARRTLSRVDG